MSLKQVKMAGFKSFVDPTTVKFPSNKVAVIGPNGCGKSNIIDAVRWVMGESSAKTLRGESMADVIFNGSSNRQPVNQASVELLFDNSNGRFGGEYANYAEIAIRREVSTDGTSNYYLNGTRCRRRDITGIFLGTGLGPRSYAIIGQGMISRIIEAKPDDLRVYLEEAAGISKYKERRRETENRIRHTRENLERLTDLREELGKQLERLQRQAKAAERYQEYKKEQRQIKAELYALRWQGLQTQRAAIEQTIKQQALDLEAKMAELRRLDNAVEQFRDVSQTHQDNLNKVQQRYYQLGADISRIEERIAAAKERRQQLQDDLALAGQRKTLAETHLAEDEARIATKQAELAQLQPTLDNSTTELTALKERLQTAEDAMGAWQTEWECFNQEAALTLQQAEVQQTDIQHLEQQQQAWQQRLSQLQQQLAQIDLSQYKQGIVELNSGLEAANARQQQVKQTLANASCTVTQQREQLSALSQQLSEQRQSMEQQCGRQASLEALQQVALGQQDETLNQWLNEHELAAQPRLAQRIEVSPGWERAVELVLGDALQSICVNDQNALARLVPELQEQDLSIQFFNTQTKAAHASAVAGLTPLISYVTTDDAIATLLHGIFAVETLAEAYVLSERLAPHESVVTRDGVWVRQGLTYVAAKESDPKAGVLARADALNRLQQDILQSTQQVTSFEQQVTATKAALAQAEQQMQEAQKSLTVVSNERAEVQAQLQIKENQLRQEQQRQMHLQNDIKEIEASQRQGQTRLAELRQHWQQSMTKVEHFAAQKVDKQQRKDELQQRLSECKIKHTQVQEKQQHLAMSVQTLKTELEVTSENLVRTKEQLIDLAQRHDGLIETIASSQAPLVADQKVLEQKLDDQLSQEEAVNEARQKCEQSQQLLRQTEEQREQVNDELQDMRESSQQLQIDHQGLSVRQTTIEEQMVGLELRLQQVLVSLTEEANENEWATRLDEIDKRIQRLGAINLVAIEEFKTESERKQYLDEQNSDLEQALATLENAIHKIDRETRARFKDTYDQVDQGMQKLFPQLFGGGQARLELTGDDLLSTGVNIVAQPPGKRNTSIHLLSGGEKALTAVALVFAIFQLNPSPFCMLDEVDAPLDDANVGRFCDLVNTLSQKVQFIFITHNKVTMELADQLMGVTMNEPGVSRLVSVDIEKALALADPAEN